MKLLDKKTESRERTVRIPSVLCEALLHQVRITKASDHAQVLRPRYEQVDGLWRRVRETAGLDGSDGRRLLRMKDLHRAFSIGAGRAGVPQIAVQNAMGHTRASQTMDYQRSRSALPPEQVDAIADQIGI